MSLTVHHGDSLAVVPTLGTFDAVVTDPKTDPHTFWAHPEIVRAAPGLADLMRKIYRWVAVLTPAEEQTAEREARARQQYATGAGLNNAYGAERDQGASLDVVGRLGEVGVAKLLHLDSPATVGQLDARDVATLHVRSTTLLEGSLILHPTDQDNHIFILAVVTQKEGCWTQVHAWGWIRSNDGKRQAFWRDRRVRTPAFFVPQDRLHTMDTMP